MCFAAFANKFLTQLANRTRDSLRYEDQRRKIGRAVLGIQATQHESVAVEPNDIFVFSLNLDYRRLSTSVHSAGET